MKKYSFFIAGILFLSACNVNVERTETKTTTTEDPAATPAQGETAKVLDPVCGMEKGSDWTEYSVKGSDTTWFCSPHCKETFAKNPDKYPAKPAEEKKG